MRIKNNNLKILKKIIILALPIMMQALLVNSVSFVDTLMIGQLGSISIAAVGVASQLFFLITMILNGISSGAGIFISQYWGAKNERGIQRTLGISFTFTTLIIGLIAIFSTLKPEALMHLFTEDSSIVESGIIYLRIVGISYIFSGLSFIYAIGFRSTGDTKTPLTISVIALSIDIIGNYLLIFGTTSVSRFVELILYIFITNKRKGCPIKFSFKYSFSFDRASVKKFFKTTSPVIINHLFWAIGFICYKIAYAKIGSDALASVQIVSSIENLFLILIQGYAGAVAIITGHLIGAEEMEELELYSNISLRFSLVAGILVALLLVILAPVFVGLFKIEPHIHDLSVQALKMVALKLPIVSINIAAIVGILRASGDTKFPMYVELGTIWLIGVPLAFFAVIVLNVSLPQAYLLASVEEFVKLCLEVKRIKSRNYIKNLTK